MNANMQEALRRLEALRQEYHDKLAVQIEAIASAWETAKTTPNDNAPIDAVQQAAHRLAGTAGALGFIEVGHAASRLEAALDVNTAEVFSYPERQSEIDLLMQNLSAAISSVIQK